MQAPPAPPLPVSAPRVHDGRLIAGPRMHGSTAQDLADIPVYEAEEDWEETARAQHMEESRQHGARYTGPQSNISSSWQPPAEHEVHAAEDRLAAKSEHDLPIPQPLEYPQPVPAQYHHASSSAGVSAHRSQVQPQTCAPEPVSARKSTSKQAPELSSKQGLSQQRQPKQRAVPASPIRHDLQPAAVNSPPHRLSSTNGELGAKNGQFEVPKLRSAPGKQQLWAAPVPGREGLYYVVGDTAGHAVSEGKLVMAAPAPASKVNGGKIQSARQGPGNFVLLEPASS